MKEVFIVFDGFSGEIEGVYSTREYAQEKVNFMQENTGHETDDLSIMHFTVDP